jgi:Protein of unknown function (DUF2934)
MEAPLARQPLSKAPQPLAEVVLSKFKRVRTPLAKPTEDQIRQRAHEIWERNHRPDGRDDEFWHQAEQELREADELGKIADSPDPIPLAPD